MLERSRLQAALDGDQKARGELGLWISRELFPFFSKKQKYTLANSFDLVQSTAEAMFKKLDQAPDEPEEFRRWMYGFAKMQMRAEREKLQRERARMEHLRQRGARPPTSNGSLMFNLRVRSKQLELLDWAIAQLPKNLRDAIEDYRAERERKSIALARGIKVRSLDRAIWQAIQALRNLVRQGRVTPPSQQTS